MAHNLEIVVFRVGTLRIIHISNSFSLVDPFRLRLKLQIEVSLVSVIIFTRVVVNL